MTRPARSDRFAVLARRAVSAAEEKKAKDLSVIALGKSSSVAGVMVVATVESQAQMRAVAEAIETVLEGFGARPLRREGHSSDRWLVLDYGGLLVHLMKPEARAFYRLEHLWEMPKRGERRRST